jgi:hypothetical protein
MVTSDLGLAFGATGVEEGSSSGGGERVGGRYRAPHATPKPIIHKQKAPPKPKHVATHHRGTVVGGAGPYTVQLASSDTTVTVAAAQHVGAGTVVAGGTVLVAVFDEGNPADALIVAAY